MDSPKKTPDNSPSYFLWTAAELAQYLNLRRRQVYILSRSGILPTVRIGRTLRFDPKQIQAWLERSSSASQAHSNEVTKEAGPC